jgi:hypothetical protein
MEVELPSRDASITSSIALENTCDDDSQSSSSLQDTNVSSTGLRFSAWFEDDRNVIPDHRIQYLLMMKSPKGDVQDF